MKDSKSIVSAITANAAANLALIKILQQQDDLLEEFDFGQDSASDGPPPTKQPTVVVSSSSTKDKPNNCPVDHVEMVQLENGAKQIEKFECPFKAGKYVPSRYGIGCEKDVCHSAMMNKVGGPMTNFLQGNDVTAPDPKTCLQEATEYLTNIFYHENNLSKSALKKRLSAIEKEIEATGTYKQTYEELQYGCKVAWRNASRCINRIQWKRMVVIDKRDVTTTNQCFEETVSHMRQCIKNGKISTTISVFEQLKPDKMPIRFWNSQATSFAGYRQKNGKILGDPAYVELTEKLIKLGWVPPSPKTAWDVLPLAIQKGENTPAELFELPDDVCNIVHIKSKRNPEINELGMRWWAVPYLTNFILDIGGVLYPCCPFNGWFMETEIFRDLADVQRYDFLPKIADLVGIERINQNLWKEEAQLILCRSILESFGREKVSIVDHHSASDGFIRFMNKETKKRGYCPSDWVWIVPPVGGSGTKVFHQEMINYQIKPMYRIPQPAYVNYDFDSMRKLEMKTKRQSHLAEQNVTKNCIVLFGTETGKSEAYAYRFQTSLTSLLGEKVNIKVVDMEEFDIGELKKPNTYLFIFTSTFGVGEPPSNAEEVYETICCDEFAQENSLPNLKFAVFGFGSSIYPTFNKCGKDFDHYLAKAGAKRLISIGLGDEMEGEEKPFQKWVLDLSERLKLKTNEKRPKMKLSQFSKMSLRFNQSISTLMSSTRSLQNGKSRPAARTLSAMDVNTNDMGWKLDSCSTREIEQHRHSYKAGTKVTKNNPCYAKVVHMHEEAENVFRIGLDLTNSTYVSGDRLGVWPWNNEEDITTFCNILKVKPAQCFKLSGTSITDRPPPKRLTTPITYHDAFGRVLSITSAPTQVVIGELAEYCTEDKETKLMQELSSNEDKYRNWLVSYVPTFITLFEQFPSIQVPMNLLLEFIPLIQPRLYSISSSPNTKQKGTSLMCELTVKRIEFGPQAFSSQGLCSSYLTQRERLKSDISCYVSAAKRFRLPSTDTPVIMIGAGTGIAPFRAFWRENALRSKPIPMTLIFGVRNEDNEIYHKETKLMLKKGVIKTYKVGYSRHETKPKTYVQDIVREMIDTLYDLIVNHSARVYVCGGIEMAKEVRLAFVEGFAATIEKLGISTNGYYMANQMIDELVNGNMYSEDVYGDTSHLVKVNHSVVKGSDRPKTSGKSKMKRR